LSRPGNVGNLRITSIYFLCEPSCFSALGAIFSGHKVTKTLRNTNKFSNLMILPVWDKRSTYSQFFYRPWIPNGTKKWNFWQSI